MPDRLPLGPYRTVTLDDGSEADFYIIPFDKRGLCEGPQTRSHLIEKLDADRDAPNAITDIFLFSHGWNNDWTVATKRYEDFLNGFMKMQRQYGLAKPDGYRPLLVGIFWPSTALVFGEKEKGPGIAAGDLRVVDETIAEERAQIREIAEDLSTEDAMKFFDLTQKKEVTLEEALELAQIAQAIYQSSDDEVSAGDVPSAEEIVEVWAAEAAAISEEPADLSDFGTLDESATGGPEAAGLGSMLKKLDPRGPVRALTVYKMKDRAGTVGTHGVGPLLHDLLTASQARLHLIGHSFGAKVVLSATCAGADFPRNVHSMLLLQPAVNHLCFAEEVPKIGGPGGYRKALKRVENPILSTFSCHDKPLTGLFHRALRRKSDLGEQRIAAAGEPPSKYAALGGFGPRACGEIMVPIFDPAADRYDLAADVPIYGLQGDRTISGHGDISNPSTWWALYNLISA